MEYCGRFSTPDTTFSNLDGVDLIKRTNNIDDEFLKFEEEMTQGRVAEEKS